MRERKKGECVYGCALKGERDRNRLGGESSKSRRATVIIMNFMISVSPASYVVSLLAKDGVNGPKRLWLD